MQFSWTGCRPSSRNIFVTSFTLRKTSLGVLYSSSPGLKLITRTYFVPSRFMRGIARLTSPRERSNGTSIFLDQRSEEHTSELQSLTNLVCRLLLEKKKKINNMEEPC